MHRDRRDRLRRLQTVIEVKYLSVERDHCMTGSGGKLNDVRTAALEFAAGEQQDLSRLPECIPEFHTTTPPARTIRAADGRALLFSCQQFIDDIALGDTPSNVGEGLSLARRPSTTDGDGIRRMAWSKSKMREFIPGLYSDR